MQMHVRTIHLDASAPLDTHARDRFAAALDHVAQRVSSVDIRIEDLHGHRHGQEIRCTARVHLDGAGVVMVQHVDADSYTAVEQAAHRVKRAARRRVGRTRSFDHERHSQRRAA